MSLTDTQRTTLRLVCDTIVPRIDRQPDPLGFFARTATDIGVDQGVEQLIAGLDDTLKTGLAQLLDALASQGLDRMPSQLSREQVLRNMSLASPEAAAGVQALAGMTLFLNYGMPDPQTGLNPKLAIAQERHRKELDSHDPRSSSRSCPRAISRRTCAWSAPARAGRRSPRRWPSPAAR